MRTIQLTDADLTPGSDTLETRHLDEAHYDRVIDYDTIVLKPDGERLFIYVRDALRRSSCELAFESFKSLPLHSSNRIAAAGGGYRRRKQDGARSRTRQTEAQPSDVVGYLDADRRFPVCRLSALTLDHYAEFAAARPFVEDVNRIFQRFAPERWAAQQAFVEHVNPDFRIPNTVFTTITVNRSWRTAAHRDSGDCRPGLGVMTAMGRFAGGELIFPKFRTAVAMRTGGLLLADVHELHGNAPLAVRPSQQRLSFVFYARAGMTRCKSVAEEVARGKRGG
jgi:hypothetical protein